MQTEPSETQPVRESVALLVAEHGVDGAEAELQRRFREGDRPDRALAGLAYLRREFDR
ncbi:MAG: hypothetical protein SVG88_06700 [Halobacteriales archaeon]|nr:hypothetical protein [Halobacteriales archaeon]